MVLGTEGRRRQVPLEEIVTLLDTNAVLWLLSGHRRARSLSRRRDVLTVSPASILELQLLTEIGKLSLSGSVADLISDSRLRLDPVDSLDWFEAARAFSWTRDPFDRLIVAHARLRGLRLATGDTVILSHLDPAHLIAL
jgi:PIN domain nuclease of toxin-antitoxin system